MPEPRDESVEDLYWDLEYDRSRGEGFTEIECPDCAEWSPRAQWQHGTLGEGDDLTEGAEHALLCPNCNHATGSEDGAGLVAVR